MDGSHSELPPDLKRRRFTAADVQAMLDAGILKDGEKVELIRGELVEMSPQGPAHWGLTAKIVAWILRHLPDELTGASQGPLRLGADHEPEPELFVHRAEMDVNQVRGPDAVLVIEISNTSVRYDLKVKAPLYAEYGVREYWVVDVKKRRTLLHRLGNDGYGEPEAVSFETALTIPGGAQLVIAELEPKG